MDWFQYKYGIRSTANNLTALDVELAAFRHRLTPDKGGLGTYQHFKNASRMLYPKREWHPWSEWRFERLCNNLWNGWTGSATSGKTDDAVHFAFMWWLAAPLVSAVIMTSTTGKMIKKRGWPILQRHYDEFPNVKNQNFNLVDSEMCLQAVRGDRKHSISGIGVKDGSISSAVGDIQGHHCPRMLLIIDEAEETPEAIYDAIPNLQSGTEEFIVLESANAESRFSAFGRNCEPVNGWQSITVEDEEWESKSGICLHFDGEKSPNIVAGETKWPFLIKQRDLDAMARRYGGTQTVGYYKFGRGFWAPEGIVQCVLSENALVRGGCFGKLIFISENTKIAALDPAWTSGGDKCVLQIGEMGDLKDGSTGINLLSTHVIPINANDPDPPRYQILNRVIPILEEQKVMPYCFGLDDTSGGVGDIFYREWSPKIKRVSFNGAPDDSTVSLEDPTPAKESYFDRGTQLWFNTAAYVDGNQLKGFAQSAPYVKHFITREWRWRGRKKCIEPKTGVKEGFATSYKARTGESPDEGDAVAILCEVARQLGAVPGGKRIVKVDQDWKKRCMEAASPYSNADFNKAYDT